MPFYKVVATVSWEFEADGTLEHAMKKAQILSNKVVDSNYLGQNFSEYDVQLELIRLKDRTSNVMRLGDYTLEQVFSWIRTTDEKKVFKIGSKTYYVRMNSDRYKLFKENNKCVACGIEGKKFILECHPGSSSAHFNLYAEEDDRLVLMTKDHILAKAFGGKDTMRNYATMCSPCNSLKASFPISYENVNELRKMLKNPDKLGTKALRKKITQARLMMVECLNGQ